jgi:hypothetical protein
MAPGGPASRLGNPSPDPWVPPVVHQPVGHGLVSGYVSQTRDRTWARGRIDAGAGVGNSATRPAQGPGGGCLGPAQRRRGGTQLGHWQLDACAGAPGRLGSRLGDSGPGYLRAASGRLDASSGRLDASGLEQARRLRGGPWPARLTVRGLGPGGYLRAASGRLDASSGRLDPIHELFTSAPDPFPRGSAVRRSHPVTRRYQPARAQARSAHLVMNHFIRTQCTRRSRQRLCAHSSCS